MDDLTAAVVFLLREHNNYKTGNVNQTSIDEATELLQKLNPEPDEPEPVEPDEPVTSNEGDSGQSA